MRTDPISFQDFECVFAVPPLAQRTDGTGLNPEANRNIVNHIASGGIRHLLYGGNAFLYHTTLDEFEELIDWLNSLDDELCCIPSIGPSFGRGLDQAKLLKNYGFPCVMALPCNDPRDAKGLEYGLRRISETAGAPLLIYCKEEKNFGADIEAGLDAIGRLVADGTSVGVKYAVVREDPAHDPYLQGLLDRMDKRLVLSGIGERPAVVHLRLWGIPGFTTGSGCVAPVLSQNLRSACREEDFVRAEEVRRLFLPLEDLRDKWGPARTLHLAIQSAGIAQMGFVPPYVTGLSEADVPQLAEVAIELLSQHLVASGSETKSRS